MENIKVIDMDADNINEYGFCCLKNTQHEGYRRKTDWLKKRFTEGIKLKTLYSPEEGTLGYIEYIPGEYVWRAVEANGYMVVHCLFNIYKKYKGKGYGSLLLKECIRDAKRESMFGVAAVTRKGPWMAGKDVFLKNGFELVDKAPPDFELLVKKFNKNAPSPQFKGDWDKRLSQYNKGLTIIRSDQCPFLEKWINEISETAQKNFGLAAKIVELKTCKDAQNAPSAFAVFSLIYKGKLLVDHPISNKRFINIMNKELGRK